MPPLRMTLRFELLLEYHDASGAVVECRLDLTPKTKWVDVQAWAASQTGFASFELVSENGTRVEDTQLSPLAWVQRDAYGRPWRGIRAIRADSTEDLVFSRKDVAARADVGLIKGVINAALSLPVIMSEAIENSIQHGASEITVKLDAVKDQLVFVDDGSGVTVEAMNAVVGKAGGSGSRPRECEFRAPIKLRGGRASVSLSASFGRYGIGAYSRLALGAQAIATIISKAKHSNFVILFREDMSTIEHAKTLMYDAECIHISAAARLLCQVECVSGRQGLSSPEASFTVVMVDRVDDTFFTEWTEKRETTLEYLAQKYVLYARGGSSDQVRSRLKAWGVLAENEDSAKYPRIIVDGQDVAHAGLFCTADVDLSNTVADLLLLAEERDNAEQLRSLDRFEVIDADDRPLATALVASLYWPSVNGSETKPDEQHMVFWNGLYLPDEKLVPGWCRNSTHRHFGRVASRISYLVFLESKSNLFAPEIHKRHLRSEDPAYKLLAASHDPDLCHLHNTRCTNWTQCFDQDESYPVVGCESDHNNAMRQVSDDAYAQRTAVLWFAGVEYRAGDFVKFRTSDRQITKKSAIAFGYGQLVALYRVVDAFDHSPKPGFALFGSPLLDSELSHQIDESHLTVWYDQAQEPLCGAWCYDARYAVSCRDFDGKIDADIAEKKATEAFPALVKLLKIDGVAVIPDEDGSLNFDDYAGRKRFSYSIPPSFEFGIVPRSGRSKLIQRFDGTLKLQLYAKKPAESAWRVVCDDLVEACNNTGGRQAIAPALDAPGVWQYKAVVSCELVCALTLANRSEMLDKLCKRQPSLSTAKCSPPQSRILSLSVSGSEPVELRLRSEDQLSAALDLSSVNPGLVVFVDFLDPLGAQISGDYAVKPEDFDLAMSRAWITVDGQALALDLSQAQLARASESSLRMTGAKIARCCDDFSFSVLPKGGELGLELWPVLDTALYNDYSVVRFEVLEQGSIFRYTGSKTAGSLADLARQANETKLKLAPRSIGNTFKCKLTATPTELCWSSGKSPFENSVTPGGWIRCDLEMRSLGGKVVVCPPDSGTSIDCVPIDSGNVKQDIHVDIKYATESNGSCSFGAYLRICAPYGWYGVFRLMVEGCFLEFTMSTPYRAVRISIGQRSTDESHKEDNELEWQLATTGLIVNLNLEELEMTVLKASVVDERGVVDLDFKGPRLALFEEQKQISPALPITRPEALLELSKLAGDAVFLDRKQAAVRVIAVDDNDRPIGVSSVDIGFRLHAGIPARLEILHPPAYFCVGDPAPKLRVAIFDARDVPCNFFGYEESNLSASLAVGDDDVSRKTRLMDAPTKLVIDRLGDEDVLALPGGWSLRRLFSRDDPDGANLKVTLVLAFGSLKTTLQTKIRPGTVVCAAQFDGPQHLTVAHGEHLSPKWTLMDVEGNVAVAHDGSFFSLELVAREEDEARSLLRLCKVVEKKTRRRALPSQQAHSQSSASSSECNSSVMYEYVTDQSPKAEVDGGCMDFETISLRVENDSVLETAVSVLLRPKLMVGCHDIGKCHELRVTVLPSTAIFRLETSIESSRENVVEIPSGTSVADIIHFEGYDEASRSVDAHELAASVKYRVNDGGQAWPFRALADTAGQAWFLRSRNTPVYIDFRRKNYPRRLARLWVRRVAGGTAARLVVDKQENVESTWTVSLVDGDDDDAVPINTTPTTIVSVSRSDLFGECEGVAIEAAVDDGTFQRIDDQAACLAVASSRFSIKLRAVDASDNTVELNQATLQAKVMFRHTVRAGLVLEDTAAMVAQVTNSAGRLAAERFTKEQDELRSLKARQTKTTAEIEQLEVSAARQAAKVEAMTIDLKAHFQRLARLNQVRADVMATTRTFEAEKRDCTPRRSATYSNGSDREHFALFAAQLEREFAASSTSSYVGFVSHLATVDDDDVAHCVAHLCGFNFLIVRGSEAMTVAHRLLNNFNAEHSSKLHINVINLEQSTRLSSDARSRFFLQADRVATHAIDFVACTPDIRDQVFQDILGDALVFETNDALERAELDRDCATDRRAVSFSRVSRQAPSRVFKPNGRARLSACNGPPAFTFGAPSQSRATLDRLSELETERDELEAQVALHPDWTDPDRDYLASARDVADHQLKNRRADLAQLNQQICALQARICALTDCANKKEASERSDSDDAEVQHEEPNQKRVCDQLSSKRKVISLAGVDEGDEVSRQRSEPRARVVDPDSPVSSSVPDISIIGHSFSPF